MAKKTTTLQTDILFWANINPDKRGAFEDYICNLSLICTERGLNLKCVLGNKTTKSMLSLFEKFKVDFYLLSESEIISKWNRIKTAIKLKPKILHLTFMDYSLIVNMFFQMIGCKVVVTDQSSGAAIRNLPLLARLLKEMKRKLAIKSVNRFIAVSNYVAKRLHTHYSTPLRKISTIYNGVDLERFKPPGDKKEKVGLRSKYLDIEDDRFIVTFVGQIIEEKGVRLFLSAIEVLAKKYEELIFVIAGTGPLEHHVCKAIERVKNNKIIFLGQRDDIDIIFKASDLVVVPSIWEEAFGFVIAEASACGIPVIGSRIGGIPEVILDGKTGTLTKPGDVNELEMAIERLFIDKELYERLSGAGREHVHKNFNLKKMVDQTVNLYEQFF